MSKSNSDEPKFVADIPTQPNLNEILNIPKLVEGIHSQARENLNQVQSALPFSNPLGFASNESLTTMVASVDGFMDRAIDRMSDRIALRAKEAMDEEVRMRNNEIQMSKQRTQQQNQELQRLKILEGVDAILSRPVTRQASVQGSSTPVNSDDEANDSEISLSTPDFTVLQAMHEFDGSVLLSGAMIRDKSKVLLSPPTIGKTLKKLIKFKYAERPQGERAGTRLTRKGNKLAVNAKKNVQIDD